MVESRRWGQSWEKKGSGKRKVKDAGGQRHQRVQVLCRGPKARPSGPPSPPSLGSPAGWNPGCPTSQCTGA